MKKSILLVVLIILVIAALRVYQNATSEPQNTDSKQNQETDTPSSENPIIYLDVRTQEEWNQGHINNAVHWDLAKLEQGQFPSLDKNAKINIYCRSGNRAGTALNILQKQGYNNLTNVGAFTELQASGLRTCSGESANCVN